MTKISQYSLDNNIGGNDKWIGSDAQNFLMTKNFTPNNVANYFNSNNVIDIGTSIRYRYQTLDPGEVREQGTISFETEIGPQVNFSDITTFLIAKNTLKGNTVTDYLDFLVDGKVMLSKASNINTFGYYKITSIEPYLPNPNFFVVVVEFLEGNGFIYEDLDYLISLVDKVSESGGAVWGSITGNIEDQTDLINYISSQITIPSLQEVTDEGNVTTTEIEVSDIAGEQYNTISNNQVLIVDDLNGFHHSFSINGMSRLSPDGFTAIQYENPTGNGLIRIPNVVDSIETFALLSDIPTKTSELTNDGQDGIHPFLSVLDLPSNLILFPTTTSADVSGYFKLVTSLDDPDYDEPAVDVSTGAITTTGQLIASLVTVPNLINGNPGVFNVSTYGNIRRTSGSGTAEFYFEIYQRNAAGTETLIGTSGTTTPVNTGVYTQFSESALWNNGVFLDTDRIVLKFYANRIAGASNPTYDFQFGGDEPVRTLVPIPLSVLPSQIPTLKEVLTQGNRTIYEADATYTTQTIDKGRFIFVINGSVSINVDDAEHSVGDELDIYNERTNGLQITLLGSAIFPDSTNVALVPPSGRILLKKIDLNFWYYSIINNSRILYLENILGSGFGSIMQVADTFEFVNGSNNLIYSLEPAFLNIYKTAGIGGKLSMFNLTDYRQFEFPDEDGTVALISDIPAPITIDATPTDGSSNAVSSNGVFDALALKQDKFIQNTSISLLVAGWALVGIYYEYTYTDANITATSFINFTPNNASNLEVTSCKMLPQIDAAAGSCKFYTMFPPQTDIVGNLTIFK